VIVNKVKDLTPEDEPRVTFDYLRVEEDLLGSHLKLLSKVHDNLLDLYYRSLFAADLKYIYLTILLHPNNRYNFTFTISSIG